MADNQRIDDLRRRVQKDPASIAFAQLAEELRRAGEHQESVDVCRAGLQIHPAYLSARVTLGRALLELNDLPDAQAELEFVLKSAPENLAAIRGLGEIHHRRGELPEALAQYRAALALARNDPDLQETVDQLSRQVEPQKPAPVDDGLSFDQMQNELLKLAPTPAPWEMPLASAEPVAPSAAPWEMPLASAEPVAPSAAPWEMPLASVEPVSPSPAPWEMPVAPAETAPTSAPWETAPTSASQAAPSSVPWEMPLASVEPVSPSPAPWEIPAASPEPAPSPVPWEMPLASAEPISPSPAPWEMPLAPVAEAPPPATAALNPWELPEDEAPVHVVAELAPPEAVPDLESLFVPTSQVPWELPAEEDPPVEAPAELAPAPMVSEDPKRDHAERTVAALEQWLAAIHVARPERSA